MSSFLCHYTRRKRANLLIDQCREPLHRIEAVALSVHFEVNLAYCFEKNGVLEHLRDENSVIAKITPETYIQLKEKNIVNDGMIPKIDNAFAAIEKGVKSVFIVKETFLKKLINENDRTSGNRNHRIIF